MTKSSYGSAGDSIVGGDRKGYIRSLEAVDPPSGLSGWFCRLEWLRAMRQEAVFLQTQQLWDVGFRLFVQSCPRRTRYIHAFDEGTVGQDVVRRSLGILVDYHHLPGIGESVRVDHGMCLYECGQLRITFQAPFVLR